MKSIFRWKRGELNGFYLSKICEVCTKEIHDLERFFSNFQRQKFKTQSELLDGETQISKESLAGISQFAGILSPVVDTDIFKTSLRLTLSHKVGDKEYSDRGLFNTEDDKFNFVRTDAETHSTDINTLATDKKRSSMVESGATPIGYTKAGHILDENGEVLPENILPTAPTGEAYSEYYGKKYLYLAEKIPVSLNINTDYLIRLIADIQKIKYNGTSIESLCEVVNDFTSEFMKIKELNWTNYARCILKYTIDNSIEVKDKLVKMGIFSYIISKRFPQVVLEEVSA